MKFIRHKFLGIFLFPSENTIHYEVANSIDSGENRFISAGFVRQAPDGKLKCYGESKSMKLASIEDDTRVLRMQID